MFDKLRDAGMPSSAGQIRTLKEQLSQEIRTRQQYILRSTRAGEEIREIRSSLDESLRNVSANEGQ